MVRARGLEPPILTEPDPKSGASANSATRAGNHIMPWTGGKAQAGSAYAVFVFGLSSATLRVHPSGMTLLSFVFCRRAYYRLPRL
jgi:hypothetical protein